MRVGTKEKFLGLSIEVGRSEIVIYNSKDQKKKLMLRLLLGILRAANGVNVFEYEIEWFNMLVSISSKGVAAHKLAW